MKAELVAPCGMNCNACSAYLAYSRGIPKKRGKITHCEGCIPREKNCAWLKRECGKIGKGKLRFCYECETFPCEHLQALDGRYRKNYGVSFIDNLKEIEKKGLDKFLKSQEEKYRCAKCSGTKSIHSGKCYSCEEIRSWKD